MTRVSGDYFEFGPFRLDPSSRSLWHGGAEIALTPKAFDTLRVLVQNAGRLVTKDDLMSAVWPDAHVVDGSVANNISALRKILNPHFDGDGPIATIARQGYRFTAPVHLRNDAAQIATAQIAAVPAVPAPVVAEPPPALSRRSRAIRAVSLAAGLVLVVAGVTIFTAMRVTTADPAEARAMRRVVAVLSMQNLSGESEYAWIATALSEAINTELVAGGQLRIITGAAVAQMLQDADVPRGASLSRKQLDEVGRNLGCDLILTGAYLHSGGRVRLDLRLDDIATGETVATIGTEAPEHSLLDLVAAANRELRMKLGLSPPTPGQTDAVRVALSSNPDALRYYFLGLEALRNHEIPRSTELLSQAITEDPDFALAHSVISISWRVIGHDDKSRAAAARAMELSPRLAREDQLAVEGAYYEVMGDVPKAIEKFQALWNFFPDNIAYAIKLVHQQLAGGELDAARVTLDEMRRLPPPADMDPRVDVVESDWFYRRGAFAQAIAVASAGADKAARRKSSQLGAILKMTQGRAELRMGDLDRAGRSIAESRRLYEGLGDRGGAADATRVEAQVLAARGELDAAQRALTRALEMAQAINASRSEMETRIVRADVALGGGDRRLAAADAAAALALARQLNNRSAIARALTALGAAEAAQGRIDAAKAHLEEARQLATTIGEPQTLQAVAEQIAKLPGPEPQRPVSVPTARR